MYKKISVITFHNEILRWYNTNKRHTKKLMYLITNSFYEHKMCVRPTVVGK